MLQIAVNEKNTYSVVKEADQWMVDSKPVTFDVSEQPNGIISVLLNGKSYTAILEKADRTAKETVIRVNGQQYSMSVKEPIDQLLANMGLDLKAMQKAEPVKAPMPGMVLKVLVAVGQSVNKGDGLIILEAMKMENLLKASAPGVVKSIRAVERTAVEKGAVLIEME